MKHSSEEKGWLGAKAAEVMQNRKAVEELVHSGDAQQLMAMLQQRGGVQEAAQAAAGGDPSQLLEMMQRLMNSKEGANLVNRITQQAKASGLTQ